MLIGMLFRLTSKQFMCVSIIPVGSKAICELTKVTFLRVGEEFFRLSRYYLGWFLLFYDLLQACTLCRPLHITQLGCRE